MPELPEVETTRRGITPYILGKTFARWRVREPRLRWPIEATWPGQLTERTVQAVHRRSKYLVLDLDEGALITHLGMSGQLRVVPPGTPPEKHDHVDWEFTDGTVIRYRDPRRFGAMLWTPDPWQAHPLLQHLGPEPLEAGFDGVYLYRELRKRRGPIKSALMDARLVVGVGNIYANEALFLSGIHPKRAANRISRVRCDALVSAVRSVLTAAIERGGTTLRDYYSASGQAGYFRISLAVYGRGGQPCRQCGEPLREIRQANRSTVYCLRCQR